jgi:hypothetical protein
MNLIGGCSMVGAGGSGTYSRISPTNMLMAAASRAIVSGYASNLFRFRKATGGSEFNVLPIVGGEPDTVTAWTDLGADAAYLVRVHDQSGNGRDVYWTSSTAPQPRLAMAKGDSCGRVEFAHITSQYMQCDCPITAGQTNTLYMNLTPSEMAGAWVLCGGTGSAFKWWMNTDALNRVYLYDGVQNPVTPNYSFVQRARQTIALQFKTNDFKMYVNGELVYSNTSWTVQASAMFQICRRVDGGGSMSQINWSAIAVYAAEYNEAVNSSLMEI